MKDILITAWLYVRSYVDAALGMAKPGDKEAAEAALAELKADLAKVRAIYADAVDLLGRVAEDDKRNASARATASYALKLLGQDTDHQEDAFAELTRKR